MPKERESSQWGEGEGVDGRAVDERGGRRGQIDEKIRFLVYI